MRLPLRLCIAAACAATALPAPVSGYQFRGNRWTRESVPIPYIINNDLDPTLDDDGVVLAIRHGYETWSIPGCTYVDSVYQGRTNRDGFGLRDNANVVSWVVQGWRMGREVIAVTATQFGFSQDILDGDMMFNDDDHDFALGRVPRRFDVEGIAAHEAGHFFGMGHSAVVESTMFPTGGPGNTQMRSLSEDDERGICALYPIDQLPGAGIGEDCSSRGECSPPLFCVDEGAPRWCTAPCKWRDDCPEGYYCVAYDAPEGDHACLPFGNDELPGADIGDDCGPDDTCEVGLFCIHDGQLDYCSGQCGDHEIEGVIGTAECPVGFTCEEFRGGKTVCLIVPEGSEPDPEPEPDAGVDAGPDPNGAGGDVDDPATSPRRDDGDLCATTPTTANRPWWLGLLPRR